MKAYLIDPQLHRVEAVELEGKTDTEHVRSMRKLIGAARGLENGTLSDMHDKIWVDGFGLFNGLPIFAFKLPTQRDPFAGRAIVIGANDRGETQPPHIPIEVIKRDIVWLGEIIPHVEWVEEGENNMRAVVTYRRAR